MEGRRGVSWRMCTNEGEPRLWWWGWGGEQEASLVEQTQRTVWLSPWKPRAMAFSQESYASSSRWLLLRSFQSANVQSSDLRESKEEVAGQPVPCGCHVILALGGDLCVVWNTQGRCGSRERKRMLSLPLLWGLQADPWDGKLLAIKS